MMGTALFARISPRAAHRPKRWNVLKKPKNIKVPFIPIYWRVLLILCVNERKKRHPMQKFTTITGRAAPLRMINVDTDIIIPKQFLKTVKRTGLGVHAFNDIRYHEDGREKEDFVLNQPVYRGAPILLTGENFGCGSSREHAPWAIADMGFRCIIAPSFADIFFNNSFKNGLLLIQLEEEKVETLMKEAESNPEAPFTVDLEQQTVTRGNVLNYAFEIDPFRKHCLLNGLDDIGLTLEKKKMIDIYDAQDREKRSWLYV
jgi:3-isopropylmalate/(R)-2-methylmalate dehydratase small subunit